MQFINLKRKTVCYGCGRIEHTSSGSPNISKQVLQIIREVIKRNFSHSKSYCMVENSDERKQRQAKLTSGRNINRKSVNYDWQFREIWMIKKNQCFPYKEVWIWSWIKLNKGKNKKGKQLKPGKRDVCDGSLCMYLKAHYKCKTFLSFIFQLTIYVWGGKKYTCYREKLSLVTWGVRINHQEEIEELVYLKEQTSQITQPIKGMERKNHSSRH